MRLFTILALLVVPALAVNYKTGIDTNLAGTEGTAYKIEQPYHSRPHLDIQTIYLKSDTQITFTHNARNVSTPGTPAKTRDFAVIGADGLDGIPDSGDEGLIRYVFDEFWSQKFWNHLTSTNLYPAYSGAFTVGAATYSDSSSVLGGTGDNGGTITTRGNFWYKGMVDFVGDEWHVLRFADDDAANLGMDDSRASDGGYHLLVVNPKTPCLTITTTSADGQFYTTPAWTYFIARINDQTSYINADTQITLTDLYAADISYRIDGGSWVTGAGPVTIAASAFTTGSHTLEYYSNRGTAPVKTRTIVKNPTHPSLAETHGNLLWEDAAGYSVVTNRLNREPYLSEYTRILSVSNTGEDVFTAVGGQGWRLGGRRVIYGLISNANNAPNYAGNNAFAARVNGWTAVASGGTLSYAQLAKRQMLDTIATIPPVGIELTDYSNISVPCQDLWYRGYWDPSSIYSSLIAYDLIAAGYRDNQVTGGLTAIEDYFYRDTMAGWVHLCSLFIAGHRGTNTPGMWDTCWRTAALMATVTMPSYSTPYYGTSGMDGNTTTYSWMPFRTVQKTWKQLYLTHDYTIAAFPDPCVRMGWDDGSATYDLIKPASAPYALGDWIDKTSYLDYANCGSNLGYYWNLQKMFNPSAPHSAIEAMLDRGVAGTLYAWKGTPTPNGPFSVSQLTCYNDRYSNYADAVLWMQGLPSTDDDSDDKAMVQAGVVGFAWYNDEVLGGDGSDVTPPSPSPSTWSVSPVKSNDGIIGTATTASDISSPPVYYRFSVVPTGSAESWGGWDTSPSLARFGLTPSTAYDVRVQVRDAVGNTTTASTIATVTTNPANLTPHRNPRLRGLRMH